MPKRINIEAVLILDAEPISFTSPGWYDSRYLFEQFVARIGVGNG